jgi:hypothetical protein
MASTAGAIAFSAWGAPARAETAGEPSAKLIAGNPPVLDYGGGVKVPCSKDAFFTLWEGETFWLTFGFGTSPSDETAMVWATKQASGVMKFMLLTLAFAPERLVKVEGNGWRKKDPAARDFVLGELDLPVRRSTPLSDAFLGRGNTVISPFWNFGGTMTGTNQVSSQPGAPAMSSSSGPTDLRQASRHAFNTCLVLKKDLALDDVRLRAVVLQK